MNKDNENKKPKYCENCGDVVEKNHNCHGLKVIYCTFCGEELKDEDVKIIQETRPWGSTYTYESIVVGYKCSNCGESIEF